MSEDNDVPNVMGDLRSRATRALWAAWISVVLVIVIIAILVVVAGIVSSQSASNGGWIDDSSYSYGVADGKPTSVEVSVVDQERSKLQLAVEAKEKEITALVQAKGKEKTLQNALSRAELDVKKLETENRRQESRLMFSTIASTIARFSAVVLGLYLVQLLVGISRYHFRLSHQLDISANTLALSGMDDLEKTRQLMKSLSGSIEFGSLPRTPIDKLTGVLSGLVKKKSE